MSGTAAASWANYAGTNLICYIKEFASGADFTATYKYFTTSCSWVTSSAASTDGITVDVPTLKSFENSKLYEIIITTKEPALAASEYGYGFKDTNNVYNVEIKTYYSTTDYFYGI